MRFSGFNARAFVRSARSGVRHRNAGRLLRAFVLLGLLALAASAMGQGTVSAAPSTLSFGNHFVGGPLSASQTVTLTNTQTVPLAISSIVVSGGNAASDFSVGNMCPLSHPLAAGASCTVNVRFAPSALGSRTATLMITDNASGSPQTVALSGTGLAPVTVAPAGLAFGSQTVQTTGAAMTVTLSNSLSASVPVSSVAATGPFAVASNGCSPSVGARAKCSIGVTFTPTGTGSQTGTLKIANSAFGSPEQVSLSGTGVAAVQGWAKIQHVIIVFQENRTPDNLFQDPVLIANGADIASSGINSSGQTIPLTPIDLGSAGSSPQIYDLNHSHTAFVQMYDNGKMDGADKIAVSCNGSTPCPPPNAQFRYVLASDVAPYFQMAEQYVFADRMFQTNQGASLPAHQFIISGTSAPTTGSTSFVASNVIGGTSTSADGCIAPPNTYVQVADPLGNLSNMYPCFEHPTLTDSLATAGVSWKYYTTAVGSIWTAPNAIEHMCGPNAPPPNATACTGPDWASNVVVGNGKILTDIANGQLAGVSWVIPNGTASDHPGTNNGTGPSWVSSIVNAVGASAYWSNTIILVTWDDWGGWYDHVAPKVVNDGTSWGSGYVYGFRVPLLVVSPYAKPGYISHVTHDFGSVLNVVERVFNLPSLGYADAYADDLSDCFNFNQTPLAFQKIGAPVAAQHFLSGAIPVTDPDDD